MRRGWLAVAVLTATMGLLAPIGAQAQTDGQRIFNLAEAYPCVVGTYPDADGIAPLQTYCGTSTTRLTNGAAPGILSLKRAGDPNDRLRENMTLDVNCFAVVPPGEVGPCFVQSYRLTKIVPGSFKCPDVYGIPRGGYRYFQFGTGVRTWWSLNFTQPGTQFILEVVSVCRRPGSDGISHPSVHRDFWTWRVVADELTLRYVIEMMHSGAISTLEIPCILGEDMYDALIKAQERLERAVTLVTDPEDPNTNQLNRIANAIFDMEALIVANCLFIDVLNPLTAFPGPEQFGAPNFQPPGNLAQTVFFSEGSAVAGIIDTIEHPCCCKLLVDLEWIAIRSGIVGTGTLLTF